MKNKNMQLIYLNHNYILFNYEIDLLTSIIYKILIILITVFSVFFLCNQKMNLVNYITDQKELNNAYGKLFWNNEISLNLDEVREEIKYFPLINVSFVN